ncbi:E3 ubiquitin-protein ligase TRIM7-like [Pogona vitticeps]
MRAEKDVTPSFCPGAMREGWAPPKPAKTPVCLMRTTGPIMRRDDEEIINLTIYLLEDDLRNIIEDDLLFIHGFHHRPARFSPVLDMFFLRACHQSHKECWSRHYHHHHHNHHESLWSQSDSDSTCSESETLSSTQAAKAWCNGLPQCRTKVQTNLIPNRQLDNLVEQLSCLEEEKAKESKRLCEEHQEPLKLFCQDDKTLICVICDKRKEHRDHQVVPLEEAAQQHKELITSHLELLKKDRAEIMTYKEERVNESKHLLTQTKAKMEKMKAEFRKLRQFLEEHEKLLMVQMEEVEKEIARKRDEHLARLSEELSSLGGLIQEMEQKCQQPPGELLQDVGRILQRSDEKVTFENPVVFLPELKWRIWDFCDINPLLAGVMNQFKDALVHGLQLQKAVQRSRLPKETMIVVRESLWAQNYHLYFLSKRNPGSRHSSSAAYSF